MPEPTTATTSALLAPVAVELAKRAIKEGWFERFKDIFRRRHRILLLGSTGVGKSNFVKSLTDPLPEVIDTLNRTAFPKYHRLKIEAQPFEFIDTPGQAAHALVRMREIRKLIRKRANLGVISLVAYGYHEYVADLASAFDKNDKVNPEFLKLHRQYECEFVEAWAPLLIDPAVTQWVITLISKADLWWSSRNAVLKYYTSPPYTSPFGSASELMPAAVPYCSVVRRYFSRGKLSPGFDDLDRQTLRAEMFRILLEAIGKPESHG